MIYDNSGMYASEIYEDIVGDGSEAPRFEDLALLYASVRLIASGMENARLVAMIGMGRSIWVRKHNDIEEQVIIIEVSSAMKRFTEII
jgi:hypothetical protein